MLEDLTVDESNVSNSILYRLSRISNKVMDKSFFLIIIYPSEWFFGKDCATKIGIETSSVKTKENLWWIWKTKKGISVRIAEIGYGLWLIELLGHVWIAKKEGPSSNLVTWERAEWKRGLLTSKWLKEINHDFEKETYKLQ